MSKGHDKELEVETLIWVKIPKKADAPPTGLTAHDVATQFGVPRNVLKSYLEREVEESQACWGLPFTLLLVVSYAIVALTHDKAYILRAVEESMDHDIIENANFAFTGQFMGHKDFHDVNSVADFWSWMSNGLLPLIFIQERGWHEGIDTDDPYLVNNSGLSMRDRGMWLHFNRIVGGVRMRQERSKNIECGSVQDLLKVYDMECVGGLGYELDPEIRSARFTKEPKREVWMYSYDDLANLQEQVWGWERERWLDKKTMKVEIAIPAYNGEFGVHVMIYINFFFSRGGHIWKKLMPLGFAAQMHPSWYYWIGDFIWMFCVFYIFVSECLEILSVVKRKGFEGFTQEYLSFWNAFDWFSLFCAFTVMGMFGAVMSLVNGLNDSLMAIKDPGASHSGSFNSTAYTIEMHSHVALLENTVQYVNNFRMVMAAYPLIIILRLFKAYSAQPRLAMVTKTLETAGQELVEFGLVFFSVFITITISGVVLFGREVSSFATLPRAVFACFRMLIGDLMWDDIGQVGRVFAFIWMAMFMIVMVMLLLNMLLAIIMKHYVQAKDSAGNAQTLWSEAAQVWRRARSERAGKTVAIEKLLTTVDKEIKKEEMENALNDEDDIHIDTDEEMELKMLGTVVTIDMLQESYREHTGGGELNEDQAVHLITRAVEEYYGHHHSAVDMDEVLKLTHKVEYRTTKLMKLSKQLDKKNPCPNEITAMSEFLKDVEGFTDELRSEAEAQRKEVQELRTLKRGVLLQLQTRQTLVSGLGSQDDDPTSVTALLATGDFTHYDWKLGSRFSDDPRPHERDRLDGRGVGLGEHDEDVVDYEHTGLDALEGGPTGPLTSQTQTRQPRYAMDDPISDDEIHMDDMLEA